MKPLIFAFGFLTILPLPQVKLEAKHFGQAMIFFPVVGLFLGMVLYACHYATALVNPETPAQIKAFTLLLVMAILTRGLHLEGLADFLDGFLGGDDRRSILNIMKDSRAGVFSVIGLIFVILGKFLFLMEISTASKATWLLSFPVLSRWSMVALCLGMKDPRENGGLATTFLQSLNVTHFMVATVVTVFLLGLLQGMQTVLPFLICLTVVWFIRRTAHRQIGGLTGDAIGATCELSEFAILLAASW